MFRLYELPDCAHCQQAKEFLKEFPVEHITRLGDPIIQHGLAMLFPNQPPQFPILVDFTRNHTVIGFNQEEYERSVEAYRSRFSAGVSDGSSAQQQPVAEAASMA
jgi:arsenate reductase-like glutaredoxin family protein